MASFNVTTSATSSPNPSNENKRQREARMDVTLASAEYKVIYEVGRLLSYPANADGLTGAQILASGGSVDVDSLTVNGVVLPMLPGTKLSLGNISVWGCLACGSASGSGRYPSQSVNPDLLKGVEFYYAPATKRLFSFSPTCYDTYVGGTHHAANIVEPKLPVPEVKKNQPKG